jgi:hypothetical protein
MIFSKTIFAAALALVALGAQAVNSNSNSNSNNSGNGGPIVTTYDGSTDSKTFSFTLTKQSDVSIGTSWIDMAVGPHTYKAKSLALTLLGSNGYSKSDSISDRGGVNSNFETLSFAKLGAASYQLTFLGTWDSETLHGGGNAGLSATNGAVNFVDNSFTSTLVAAPVPEPESYAMMLAGLGLMGTIARRRKQKNTSV